VSGAALVTIGDFSLALSDRRAPRESPYPRLLRPVKPCPESSGGVVSVDPPFVGDGTNDVQAMVAGWIDHSLVPRAAVVFDFDPGVKAGADCGPDGEGAAGQARSTVQGSVGRELGSAEDHVVCSRAVSEYCAQVGSDSTDVLGAAGIGDVSGA
jgi:hypothetical protein